MSYPGSSPRTASARRSVHPLADHEIGMTWRRTFDYIDSDFERLLDNFGDRGTRVQRAFYRLLPNVQLVFWYRISRCLYIKGWRQTAQIISLISSYMTSAEIPPQTSIGPGLFVGHAPLVNIRGKIGSNFTVYGAAGTGGGYGEEDIGGGRGFPVVGDNVSMAHFSTAQGPIRIGNNVKFGPNAHIHKDVPDGAIVIGSIARIQRVVVPESAMEADLSAAANDPAPPRRTSEQALR